MAIEYSAGRLNTWAESLASDLDAGYFVLKDDSVDIVVIDLEATAYDVTGAVMKARGADGTNPISSGNRLSGTSLASGTIDNYSFYNSADGLEFHSTDTTGLNLATLVSSAAGILFEFTDVQHTLTNP